MAEGVIDENGQLDLINSLLGALERVTNFLEVTRA